MFSIGLNVNLFYFYVKLQEENYYFINIYLFLLPNLFYFYFYPAIRKYYHSFQTNRIELHLLFFLSPSSKKKNLSFFGKKKLPDKINFFCGTGKQNVF